MSDKVKSLAITYAAMYIDNEFFCIADAIEAAINNAIQHQQSLIDAKDAEIERLADSERYAWKNAHEINKQMVEQGAEIERLKPLAEIGAKWNINSSLEAWFPYSAEQIQRLTKERDDALKEINRIAEKVGVCGAGKCSADMWADPPRDCSAPDCLDIDKGIEQLNSRLEVQRVNIEALQDDTITGSLSGIVI